MNPQLPHSPNALDAEERALVKVLPRLHGRTAPSPDLDASILAAAQASVRSAKPTQPRIRRRGRWFAPAALAASMVVAVGMAWQLRPLSAVQAPQSDAAADADATTAVSMIESPSAAADSPMVQSKAEAASAVEPAQQQISSVAERTKQALAAPAPPAPAAPPPPPPAMAMSMEAEVPAGSSTSALEAQSSERALRAAAPAIPADEDGKSRAAAPTLANKAAMADSARPAEPALARPAPVASGMRNEADKAADAGFADDPDEDIPPATANSPAVRDAWLRRIRELIDRGERQEAKASLAEFRRRYPDAVLPSALHALEIEP